MFVFFFFFFQAEDGIRDHCVTGVQTCALPISFAAVRLGGRVQLLGIPKGEVPIDFASEIIFKGITVYGVIGRKMYDTWHQMRSEEHTSELQSHSDLVCRLLLEKKKKKN